VLINLLPEFLAVLEASDREKAYYKYLENHRAILQAYWHNYVMDLDSPPAAEIISQAMSADRSDLWELIASVDVVEIVEQALARSEELLGVDREADCYVMVGMGAANAGELVVNGRGVMFICLEHFTGRANPDTYSLGLTPDLIPLWVGHEYAHLVRYTSPASNSDRARARGTPRAAGAGTSVSSSRAAAESPVTRACRTRSHASIVASFPPARAVRNAMAALSG